MAVNLVGALRAPLAELADKDARLADYLRRAAHGLAATLNEARLRDGQEQAALLAQANESISDVYAALELAEARGHLQRKDTSTARQYLDREHDLMYELG